MAAKKSPYKKCVQAVHIEPQLIELLEKESRNAGCISHPRKGFSISEISRRLIKGRLLELKPYIKESAHNIDWSEAI